MGMYEDKRKMRNEVLEVVNRLDDEYIKYSNCKIVAKLLNSNEYKKAKTIFSFVSTLKEVDTISIIKKSLDNYKIIGVPKCIAKGIMEVYEIKSLEDLVPGKYDILEPKEGCKIINKEDIDLIIMPCVSCNEKGQRLGYGGGYYDRFLEHCSAVKLILCREKIMRDEIPMASHDILMDVVVTEDKIYKRNML